MRVTNTINGFYWVSYLGRKQQGKCMANDEEGRQPHAKGKEKTEILRAFSRNIFSQASEASIPSNKICRGDELLTGKKEGLLS